MLKEFKEFVMRGNVLDLAVAVIIGGAFGKIISSLVNDILMPLIGLLMGGVDFAGLSFTVGNAVVTWGNFVQAIVDFVIVAFVIFMLVRAANQARKRKNLLLNLNQPPRNALFASRPFPLMQPAVPTALRN